MPVPNGPCEAGTPANRRIGSGIPRCVGAGCESLMGSSRVGTHRACSGREVEVMTGRAELPPAGKVMVLVGGPETRAASVGQNGYLYAISMVAALGGLLFGYDWVVIGGAKPFYEAYFGIVEPRQQSRAMICALLGCLVGAVGSGFLSESIGRRRALLLAATTFAIAAVGIGSATRFTTFVIWRMAGGL